MARSPALLAYLLLAAACCPAAHASASVPYVVEFLSGEQLEHQTQASTGAPAGFLLTGRLVPTVLTQSLEW